MKTILFSFFLILVMMYMSCKEKNHAENLTVINIMETFMAKDSVKLLENDSSGFNIAYLGDFEIYEYPTIRYITDDAKLINGVPTIVSRESKDTLFNFFVTKTGSEKVFNYRAVDSKTFNIITRDSLYELFDIDSASLTTLNFKLGIPHKTIRNKKKNVIESEHYLYKNPKGPTFPDTISRYYNVNFKDIKFSYSSFIDMEKRSKLVLTRFVYLPRKVKQKNGEVEVFPYREDSSLMRKVPAKRKDTYLKLIERFKRDISSS